ncbi:hypothetical protein ADL00_26730 [Streptomyces sp. AS58]|uniref:SDR family NAD(P)-dependent oxidoreductase n=1 Tax=Streptomyces cadmiisoli TaxID=2184053 RepID=A0A2Z4JEF3_9ACTN|nr:MULTISPECIES: SDR family NAD(P)-dependent oxidoreductase [Streptomyces]AWW43489.1 SDR family NAD(P)-dependent oxidoreductase [Streptomyces cadmiisoli]KOV57640.1 hypothetical protein ADL00_26730 [Streptomyces sp. AS58]
MRMKNKIAIVTGAARGNGRAIALRLAEEGATVVLGDVNEDQLNRVTAEIEAAGGRATAVRCDVTSEADVAALIAAAEEHGPVNAVVAQAGISYSGPLDSTPLDQWQRLMNIDVTGTFLTVREAVRSMLRTGGGSIVTMSGTYAYMAEPGTTGFCAAKAAILSFTRAVAAEYGDRDIRCNAIVPGYVMTEMVQEVYDNLPDGAAAHEEISKWHALGRIATPQEVANMALFLCSDESSFSTGSPFLVDGGLTTGINSFQRPIARPA